MEYDINKVHDIIDDVIIHHMNEQDKLFGNEKEVVTTEMIYSKRRKKEFVVCRQLHQYVADYIFNEVLNIRLTLSMNGHRFGQDHSTVHHSVNTIKSLYGIDKQMLYMICNIIDSVIRRLKQNEGSKQAHRWYTWLYPKSDIY